MQMSDGSIAMNVHHHIPTAISGAASEHFDILNLNMGNDYHQFNVDYWNNSYKNGSTPMKEMEGERKIIFKLTFKGRNAINLFTRRCYFAIKKIIFDSTKKHFRGKRINLFSICHFPCSL